jgi:hypothetical protein
MTDRERIYNLVDKVCDLSIKAIDKITELKQENSKLKQQVAELEKPKKKHKFRAMTNAEFCRKWQAKHNNRCFGEFECCPLYYAVGNMCCFSTKPFRLPNGKYIFIEVTNDA